jgi:hypothetical protein
MTYTVGEIKQLVRDLANMQDSTELSDSNLLAFINNVYQNKLKTLFAISSKNTQRFTTIPQIDSYSLSTGTHTVRTVWVGGETVPIYTDQALFGEIYRDSWLHATIDYGDGIETTFTTTLQTHVLEDSVTCGDDTESFEDSSGTMTGSLGGTGTIDYDAGTLSITFAAPPAVGITVTCQYAIYTPSQPQAALYNNDTDGLPQLTFRPIPDEVYHIRVESDTVPDAFTSDADVPPRREWSDLIAYMTAIDVSRRYGNHENAARLTAGYEDAFDIATIPETRIMSNNRPIPRW